MRAPRIAVAVFALAALTLVAACGDDGTGPEAVPGTLRVQLTTPNSDDAAILLEIRGGEVNQLDAVNPSHAMYSREVGSSVIVVVVGSIVDGGLLEWRVSDVRTADSYTVRVIEVADRSNELRSRVTDYELVITDTGG